MTKRRKHGRRGAWRGVGGRKGKAAEGRERREVVLVSARASERRVSCWKRDDVAVREGEV